MTIESFCGGKVVVIKNPLSNPVPLFCGLCEYPMVSSDDCITHRRIGVCSKCSGRWENNKTCNLAGKQYPDKSSEEWNEYMEERSVTSVRTIHIR